MPDCAIAGGRPVPDGRPAALCPAPAACRDLLELLAGVTDGRPGQGRDHPVAAVLVLAAAAVVAGSRSFAAIAGRAADVPADVLEDLYRRCGASRPVAGPPSKATIWRVVTGADTAALDAVTGTWLMERARAAGDLAGTGQGRDGDAPLIPVRVDGKTVRGARNTDGSQVHLPAVLAGKRGVVAAQTEAGAKTNEIPMIIPLLDGLDLAAHLHSQEEREGAPVGIAALDGQACRRGDAPAVGGVLRAAVLRPLSWFPSRARLPRRAGRGGHHLDRDDLVHRGRHIRLLRIS